MISLSDIFIHRPVMTVLTMLTILLFGLIAYKELPVSDLPNVDYPTINVTATLPGASPETMGASVATVLEKQFSSIAGIDSMSSVSTSGRTQITLQFSLERDIDSAAQDVQSALSSAARQLPDGMPAPPSFRKVNPADIPILYISLSSPTLPLTELDKYGQTMSQRLSTILGVAQVQVRGSQKYAVRIQLDPVAMQAMDLDVEQVAAAVAAQNSNRPMGQLNNDRRKMTLQIQRPVVRGQGIPRYRRGRAQWPAGAAAQKSPQSSTASKTINRPPGFSPRRPRPSRFFSPSSNNRA